MASEGDIALVTGGAGFLGSHLVDRLLTHGRRVVIIDSLVSSTGDAIAHLARDARVRFERRDVADPFAVDGAGQIWNLACPASPLQYQTNPVHTMKTSVMGAIHALDEGVRNRCPVLQASTSEVYGDPEVHPQPETYHGSVNPFGPRACYDEGKRAAEALFFDYRRMNGLPVKVARIFNTYGPRMHPGDGRVVSNFIMQALTGSDITLFGDGSQTRSFCYVDDLVDGLVALMATDDGFTGPVNLGNPQEFTMRELAETVLALTGSRSRIVHRPLPQDDPRQRRPDISLARRELGWSPKVGLEDGLRETIAHFRKVVDLP